MRIGYLSAFLYFRRCFFITKELKINEEIRDKEVRLIDEDGEQAGIVSIEEAMKRAIEKDLDLVNIAPQAKPPVCKIMDYGKYRYEQTKREKEAKKNQKIINVKEIRLSAVIEQHDLQVKQNQAQKFLKDEDKVKVSIRFRGREIGFANQGKQTMLTFAENLKEFCTIEKEPKLEGRNMIMILAPVKQG